MSTFTFAAAEARRLAGEMVPIDASDVGEGKLGFTLRVPDRRRRRDQPVQLPAQPRRAQAGARDRGRVPGGAQAGVADAALGASRWPSCCSTSAGFPPGHLNVVTGSGGTVGNAIVDDPDIAIITFTGSPEVGWGIRARAPRKKVGLELGNNAPVIIEPDGDVDHRGRRRSRSPASATPGSRASRRSASTCTRRSPTPFLDELVPRVEALVVGDPLDEATDVSALISARRARSGRVVDRRGGRRRAPRSRPAASSATACSRPTVLTNVQPDMKVCSQEVFGPVVAVQTLHATSTTRFGLANDTRYGLQAAIFTRDLPLALRAARELDFGGVLVNEVPTWRTDQMPYGGVRDSGNTREGPHYAVHEMTETRLVVLG